MSFQSFKFAVFLAAAVGGFYAVPKKGRLAVLLIFNILFFEWADPFAGIWLLSSVCLTWGCALLVEKGADRTKRRLLIGACLSFQLILLAVFKYLPVWNEIINKTYGRGLQIVHLDVAAKFGLVAPIGISFYTLEAIGYLIDVSRGKYPAEKSFWRFAAFLSFFPNIMSGPIERGDHFLGQLREITEKKRRELLNYDRVMQGLIAMLLGYGMKLIVAQRAEILVNQVYSMYQDANSFTMLMAALFYAVQIYCDFASYSMIAVGVGRLFGFELVQNFKQPYFSRNLTDFWRRWHISLSNWLRDYIYIPLGGGRKGLAVRQRNILLVFLISGLWHGGAPQFLAWGLLHGAGQVVQDFYKKAKQAVFGEAKIGLEKLRHMLSVLLTFFTVMCFWIFFRSESVSMAVICLKNMFTRWNGFLYWRQFLFTMGLEKTQFFIAVAGIAVLFGIDLISEKKKQEPAVWIYRMPLPVRWAICLFLIGAVFVVGQYGKGFDPSGFIYVEF